MKLFSHLLITFFFQILQPSKKSSSQILDEAKNFKKSLILTGKNVTTSIISCISTRYHIVMRFSH